ncbi:transcriptional regulator [Streptomyces sp. NPDC059785]|uniref:transcriptional regulator n=1 Tax=Streptomyces sp. NPDC059785 TaxID=3346945 RepID=UPI00365ADCB7
MPRKAAELLESITGKLAPDPHANRLLPLIGRGAARRSTLAALCLEQRHVIEADRRAFLHLAQRSAWGSARPGEAGSGGASAVSEFFTVLAEGEAVAGHRLGAFGAACGVDEEQAAAYQPLADCQSYPAYVAWLALNGEPADVVLALNTNFAAWGDYCATIADALRRHYGYDDAACAFFDLFAEPGPELRQKSLAAVEEGLDSGRTDEHEALRYGRLLQAYEARFWHALWELDQRTG